MKKFMKICGFMAAILVITGIILGSVAALTDSKTYVKYEMREAVGDTMWNWVDRAFGWTSSVQDDWDDFDDFNINDTIMFREGIDIARGDVDMRRISEDAVSSLDVELGGCTFNIETSSDSHFYLEASQFGENSLGKIQIYQEGETLYVKGNYTNKNISNFDITKSIVTLYIPENFYFENLDIEFGAGSMYVEGPLCGETINLQASAGKSIVSEIRAENLYLDVGAGSLEIYEMNVEYLEAEVGAGSLQAHGDIQYQADIECSAGGVILNLSGNESDFDYDLTCSVGQIEIGGNKFNGFDLSKYIDNNADKEMEIDCSAGAVYINFAW